MDKEQLKILELARQTYGPKAQIAVSAEECCELAKELLKYLRYETHETAVKNTRNNVISELADVIIISDHITNIFNITQQELNLEIEVKIERLQRWIKNSNSFEHTTEDRELKTTCEGCFWNDHWDDPKRPEICRKCFEENHEV